MSRRFDQLVARHHELRARCDAQRHLLGQAVHDIEDRLSIVDRGYNVARRIAHQPALIAGCLALLVLLRPQRLLLRLRPKQLWRWASRGLLVYSTARRVRRLTHWPT